MSCDINTISILSNADENIKCSHSMFVLLRNVHTVK